MLSNRMRRRVLFFLIIFLFIKCDLSYADIDLNIKFNNITIEDGLSQSTVGNMYQDSRGYIWIGTEDGLNRYNGKEFKHYKNDKYSENSLISNYIRGIAEDTNGVMWIATLEGISRINIDTDEIRNYSEKEDKGNLSNSNVCNILVTKDNRIFAATEDGLNLYYEKNEKFYRILDKENDLPSQYIYSVKEDSRGHIWISTDEGVVEVDKELNIVNKYEDTIGKADVYTTYDDSKGYVWVCTLDKGLFRINLNNAHVDNYRETKDKYSISSSSVRDVVLDSNGKLWVATDKGISKFDYEKEIFTNYNDEPYEKDSLIDEKTDCLLKDNSGLIWVGTYSGISVFDPVNNFYHFKSKMHDKNSLSGNMVNGIYKDNDKVLWVGTNKNGLNIITEDEIKHLNPKNSNLISYSIQDITGIDNYVCVGTDRGLSIIEKYAVSNYTYNITNYTDKEGLPSNRIRSLFVDSKGYLWVGTNKGLAILDIKSGQVLDITYILDKMGVDDKNVGAVYEDSNGNYYIGCFLHGGLIKINPDTKEYKVYRNNDDNDSISNNSIRYITEDLDGNILVGTSHGLNVLDLNTDKFIHYTENDGLINNTVYGILVDENNDIWMSTNGGISKLSMSQGTFKNFTVGDGLQSNEFNGRSCFNSNDGYLYFGGINGFNVIDINDIKISAFQPKVIFENFEVNGIAKKAVPNMHLNYNENNIKINFFTDDYRNTKITKYYYRLNGEDKWNVADNNSLLLANLAPGKYNLEIKTMTQHGVVSEVSHMSFDINAPIWRSKQAIFIYCLVIIIYVYICFYRVKKMDKLVDVKTCELRREMEKNEELFNKVLKLEKSKNNYFVNLSHELRTPLNILSSINQLINSCLKNDTILTTEKLMYYMDIMSRNCNRLLNLINNLIDYTKIENNNYIVIKQETDIVYLVEETVLDMKDYIEEKGLEVIFDTDVEEKLIQCNKLDIERCIINLVNNAAKFTPEGGLIQVLIYNLDDKVKIVVKDNGIGISEENQKIIFDRFHQVVDENSEQKGGSGLGLTITKQLIKLHGGEIYVESEVGVGSEFIIVLPVCSE